MSQNDLKNNFKDKLDKYASGIDPDALWNDISDRVPQKKKRRGGIWWLGAFGILMIFFGIYAIGSTNEIESNRIYSNSGIATNPESQISASRKIKDEDPVSNSKLAAQFVSNSLETEKVDGQTPKESLSHDEMKSANENTIASQASPTKSQSLREDSYYESTSAQKIIKDRFDEGQSFAQTKNRPVSDDLIDTDELEVLSTEENVLADISRLPFLNFEMFAITKRAVPKVRKKRTSRIRPNSSIRKQMLLVDYAAGSLAIGTNKLSPDLPRVNDGIAHSSQAVRIQYAYFLNPRFYTKAIVNLNISTNKFTASISRDTIIPSSYGEQLLATNIYKNGVIDTENGIPEVLATYTRDVQKLNHFQSLNVGIGLGYVQKIGNLSFHLETSLTRSLSINNSGLSIEGGAPRIKDLTTIKDYYSQGPLYDGQLDLRLEIPLTKDISFAVGGQYQHGFSNRLLVSTKDRETLSSVRGTVGFMKYW